MATSACHHRADPALASAGGCEPAARQPAADMDVRQLDGTYAVTFVATGGAQTGHATRGRLVLRPQASALVAVPHADTSVVVTQPSVGSMELMLEEVGATRMGDPASSDAAMPGVGVYATSGRSGGLTGLVARVGSGSNVRGLQAFDAGYFVLYIQRVATNGIWGGWASSPGAGGMVTADAVGHFCAVKLAR